MYLINTMRPRRNRRHFADDIFKCIFLNENVLISIKISLKFIPKGPINNIPTLVQIMAWRRPGDKPLSEPMMMISLTHICVAPPQWVKKGFVFEFMTTRRVPSAKTQIWSTDCYWVVLKIYDNSNTPLAIWTAILLKDSFINRDWLNHHEVMAGINNYIHVN